MQPPTARPARFARLAETGRATIALSIDGRSVSALEGDTVLTALLTNGRRVRDSEFGDGARAGFCLMGACQDCWVWDMIDGGTPPARLHHDRAGGHVQRHPRAGRNLAAAAVNPRIVVVGAGPAGVRAAEALVQAGVRPILINEGRRDGGQIYRRQPEGFTRSHATLYGSEAAQATGLHNAFDTLRPRVDYRGETLVWNVTANAVHTMRKREAQTLPFDALIICAGATDRLLPILGWNLAGCYSLGAAQIALKAQACAIGKHVVFAGTGPLLYLVAAQYVKAGARVEAVLDTSPAMPPAAALRGLLARPRLLLRGLGLVAQLRRAGVRVWNGVTPLSIAGEGIAGVQGITVRDARGAQLAIACDAVALGYHLRAETQLADLAQCEFAFEALSRQWLPRIDMDGRGSRQGVYLAGDGVRILGADGAEASGRLAALAALSDLGHAVGRALFEAEAPALRRTLATMDAFRAGLALAFPWPHAQVAALPDAAVLCRTMGTPTRASPDPRLPAPRAVPARKCWSIGRSSRSSGTAPILSPTPRTANAIARRNC